MRAARTRAQSFTQLSVAICPESVQGSGSVASALGASSDQSAGNTRPLTAISCAGVCETIRTKRIRIMGKRVHLRDIAKSVGLSMAIVSRPLADHHDISSDTKERVRHAAQAMSYIPNFRARYMRAKHSRLIALIVPEMNTFFVPSMISGINHVVQQNDYSLIVFQSDNAIVQERRLVEYCTHLSADGVLLVLSSETSDLQHLEVLRECGIPVVFLDPNVTHLRHSGVEVGERTAHILIGMIEHNSDAMMDVRIRTTLVELGSVATRSRPPAKQRR